MYATIRFPTETLKITFSNSSYLPLTVTRECLHPAITYRTVLLERSCISLIVASCLCNECIKKICTPPACEAVCWSLNNKMQCRSTGVFFDLWRNTSQQKKPILRLSHSLNITIERFSAIWLKTGALQASRRHLQSINFGGQLLLPA